MPKTLRATFLLLSFALGAAASTVACGDDTGDDGSSSSGDTSPSTGGGGPGSGGQGATGGEGGTGGTGGGAGGMGTGGTGGGAGGMGGGGMGGGSSAGDHLVISEIAVAPNSAEFIEIYNPTSAAVDLGSYYLSDNSTYVSLQQGMPWDPITNNPGSDFFARFPPGSSIPAGGTIVVAATDQFEATYGKCPDFVLDTQPLACASGMAQAMVIEDDPDMNGLILGTLLSNNREMVILFEWDGTTQNVVKDVDYVTWGMDSENGTRVDKTNVPGYQPDTPVDMQKYAPAPPPTQSIERCTIEAAEKTSGGNGITGHDETSEDMGAAFVVQTMPSPGTKNGCL